MTLYDEYLTNDVKFRENSINMIHYKMGESCESALPVETNQLILIYKLNNDTSIYHIKCDTGYEWGN